MKFLLLFISFFLFSNIISIQVTAQTTITCNTTIAECGDADGDGIADFEPDFVCVLSKSLNTPTSGRTTCCENKCKDNSSSGLIDDNADDLNPEFRNFTIFNTRIKISYDKIPTIVNLLFSTILGVYAIYAAIRGVYIYAIKLPSTTKTEDIESVNKEGAAIITGFIIALAFLFLTQIVFSLLGLPAINEINLTFDPESSADGPGITVD